MITVTAPGKAVLSGEYAVLEGAPAISTAVNRRARVSIANSLTAEHCITTPGYLEGSWRFRVSDTGDMEWLQPLPETTAFSLVEGIWKSFDTTDWPELSVTVDTQAFRDAGTGLKYGLGSSAAIATALAAALQSFSAADLDIDRIAYDAHGRFQGGRGSGVDIATSFHGGLIEYRRGGAAALQLQWPEGLRYQFLWSGRAVATPAVLAKLAEGRSNADSCRLLSDCAEAIANAWSTGDCREILHSFPTYIDALQQFSVDHDLGIFDAGHEGLVQVAADAGVIYKPCGAGGGDMGVVLTDNLDAMTAFCEQATQQGFQTLDLEAGAPGVEVSD